MRSLLRRTGIGAGARKTRRLRVCHWPGTRVLWLAPLLALAGTVAAQTVTPALTNPETISNSEAGVNGPDRGTGTPDAAPVAQVSDPPSRVVRIGVLDGNVSMEPAAANTFSAAELNGVLTGGDRVYTDPSAAAELQAGQMALRLGGGTDLTVSAMTDTLAQFGIAAGAIHLHVPAIDPGSGVEVDSPDAAVTVLQPGDIRVDVDAAAHTTTVTLVSGQVQLDTPSGSQKLEAGQCVRVHGPNAESGEEAYVEPQAPADTDTLDTFSAARDTAAAPGLDAASPYLNPDTTGGADLADNGSWDTTDFGPVWYPTVSAEWRPYCYGHWRYVAPWGWTWVGAEPWAFAPFHYGRWAEIGGRWGWVPGPRILQPVYAPALVVFAGGQGFASSLGYPAGFGITAWFPLGPHEPYLPAYRGSTLYVNRLNASNLHDPDLRQAQSFYNQRAANLYAPAPGVLPVYANREATVAVPQSSFASGTSVSRSSLRLPIETLAAAPLPGRPPAHPTATIVGVRRATALPPVLARPVVGVGGRMADEAARGEAVAQAPGVNLFQARATPNRAAGQAGRAGPMPEVPGRLPNAVRPGPPPPPHAGPATVPARGGAQAHGTPSAAQSTPSGPRH